MIDEAKLREFLEEELAVDVSEINVDSPLFSTGLVDSFALVSLMTFLEDEGNIRVSPSDVNLDNMDSISRVLNYFQSKQEATPA
jgi:acyl carrier protein